MNASHIEPAGPITVLLVDDEDPFRETLAKRLARKGLAVAQAGDGRAALAALARQTADVVVLDVKMPGLSGLEVLQQVKAAHPETEVILLTGQASTADGVAGIKAGAFDYLTKPVELEHLVNKIVQAHGKILRQRALAAEAEQKRRLAQQMIVTERLASLGTMAAGVAHEINNPLAVIQEAAGWIRELVRRPEMAAAPFRREIDHAVGKIEKSVDRARRITQQLLGAVQKTEAIFREVDLAEILDEALESLARHARSGEVQFEKCYSTTRVWTDPGQIRQVFQNLLANAVYAVRGGGTVTISVEEAGDQVVVCVRDTGEGIPPENLDRIFEPFFTTKPVGEGTGLGLFVSRGIVDKLGGTIAVQSRPGKGTEFRVILPRKPKPDKEASTP